MLTSRSCFWSAQLLSCCRHSVWYCLHYLLHFHGYRDLFVQCKTCGRFLAKSELNVWDEKIESKIPPSLRDFDFLIERDTLVQLIHLWRSFIRSSKSSDACFGRPSKVKLRPTISMQWNYTIDNVYIAHRLMMSGSLPSYTGLSSQQTLEFKFFTLLRTNKYIVWILFNKKKNWWNDLHALALQSTRHPRYGNPLDSYSKVIYFKNLSSQRDLYSWIWQWIVTQNGSEKW